MGFAAQYLNQYGKLIPPLAGWGAERRVEVKDNKQQKKGIEDETNNNDVDYDDNDTNIRNNNVCGE